MTPLLSLGPHIFQVAELNYQAIKRKTEAQWPEIGRFGNRASSQFTGLGKGDAITIEGLLFPEEFNDFEKYEELRVTQAAGRPVSMMGWAVGGGMAADLFGRVIILTIEDTQSRIGRSGRGQRVEYSVSLRPFTGDGKPIGLFG